MSYGLLKTHHGIMKATALEDYNAVQDVIQKQGLSPIEPNGKHWHKIEDATAAMLKLLKEPRIVNLNRGLNYYLSL